MADVINLAIQLWLVLGQKFFLITRKQNSKLKEDYQNLRYSENSMSKIFIRLKNKQTNQAKFTKRPLDKISFELYSILTNDQHYLVFSACLNSAHSKKSKKKNICKNFFINALNFIRNKILFSWLENFFFTKIFSLKFDSLNHQLLKGYFLKYLKSYFTTLVLKTMVSRKRQLIFLKANSSFFPEIIKLTSYFNNKSLNLFLLKQIKRFFLFLKTIFVNKKMINYKTIRYIYFLGLTILTKLSNKKKSIFEKFRCFLFENIIVFSDYSFSAISKVFAFLIPVLPRNKAIFKKHFLSEFGKNNNFKHYIKLLLKMRKDDIFYKLVFFSNIKSEIFELNFRKKFENSTMNTFLSDNHSFPFWRFFFFLELFRYFKSKEIISFKFLPTVNAQEKNLKIKKLISRIKRYLFFNYKRKILQLWAIILPCNIHLSTGLYTFFDITNKLNFNADIQKLLCFMITLILIILVSNQDPFIFEGKFLIFNKIIFSKNCTNVFQPHKQECIKVCKNLCDYISTTKIYPFDLQYKTWFSRIYERSNSDFIEISSIKSAYNKNFSDKKIKIIRKFDEFFRDLFSIHKITGKIRIVNSKTLSSFKNEIQFFPLKLYRAIRAISRDYFIQNLREKQLEWNFEAIRVLIQGSAIYFSKNILYFVQVNYEEIVMFLSLNRCNVIFESELGFLLERLNILKQYNKKFEKKNILFIDSNNISSKEKILSLNINFFSDYHLYKDTIIESNYEKGYIKNFDFDSPFDHIYVTEALIAKILKIKRKMKINNFLFNVKKKLNNYFPVDPRGILLQIKSLNEKEFLNFSQKKKIYFYL